MRLSGLGSVVVIGNPQAVEEIFSKDSQFDVGRANALAQPLVGRNSLMLMDGARHRRERKLLMPPFHGERLVTAAGQICTIAEQVANQWPVGQPFVARTAMQKISLEVILQIVFGLSEGERYQQLKPLLTSWLDLTDSPLRSSILFLRFLQKDWGEIEQRRNKLDEGSTDILSLMLAVRDELGQAMSDEELRDELLTILFAGHETTATTLAWALYQIHQHSDVREKLLQELDSLGENSSPMKIAQLPYLTAVCQETLRMYPVIPVIFPRITKSSVNIAGHLFDPETTLMPSIYLVHYREDLYPHAQQFKPERFLLHQYSPWEYLPFGGGSRRCLGAALAQLEMKLVLATILSKYQLALANDKPIKLQRRGFTLAPTGGVRMVMTRSRSLGSSFKTSIPASHQS